MILRNFCKKNCVQTFQSLPRGKITLSTKQRYKCLFFQVHVTCELHPSNRARGSAVAEGIFFYFLFFIIIFAIIYIYFFILIFILILWRQWAKHWRRGFKRSCCDTLIFLTLRNKTIMSNKKQNQHLGRLNKRWWGK